MKNYQKSIAAGSISISVEEGVKVADIINEAGPQNLATVVGEIKQLLEQLFQNYPTHTTAEQMEVATKAIESIESNPSWKYRVINAAREGGLASIEKALDNPHRYFHYCSHKRLVRNFT